jgi:hypothetical protein
MEAQKAKATNESKQVKGGDPGETGVQKGVKLNTVVKQGAV